MIVILEGANGVGKSTYVKEFEKRGYKHINPFRRGAYTHDSAKNLNVLNDAYGLGLNTHVEDLYVWEMLAEFKGTNIVLDRTIPSAIAYGAVHGHPWYPYSDKKEAQLLFDFWIEQVSRVEGGVVYVWLTAPYQVAKERCVGRWMPRAKEYKALERWFNVMFIGCINVPESKMQRVRIDTAVFDVNKGVDFITKRMKRCQQ